LQQGRTGPLVLLRRDVVSPDLCWPEAEAGNPGGERRSWSGPERTGGSRIRSPFRGHGVVLHGLDLRSAAAPLRRGDPEAGPAVAGLGHRSVSGGQGGLPHPRFELEALARLQPRLSRATRRAREGPRPAGAARITVTGSRNLRMGPR